MCRMRRSTTLRWPALGAAVLLVSAACAPDSDATTLEERGAAVAERAGCLACHTTDGRSSTGLTWRDLFGSEVRLVDGRTLTADEEYLERSIVDPSAEVVDGYRPVMPTDFGNRLTEDEIQALIAYIRSLS